MQLSNFLMQKNRKVFLLTGSNIEPRANFLYQAENAINLEIGEIVKRSSIYESEPWGFVAETAFLNQVLVLNTTLSALEILNRIHSIEKYCGRTRNRNNYISRTLDIDILYIDNEIIECKILTVPHPRLHERKFTLMPLVEVAADFEHPILKNSNIELYRALKDKSQVWKYKSEVSNNDL